MASKITDSAISVAAFGPGGKQIAFSPNNHRVFIANCSLSSDCGTWPIVAALESAHNQPISGIAWHHEKNRLLTCAHDRTAFVWELAEDGKTWIPSVVMLDAVMTKGCTDCAWVPSGDRIVIASAFSAIAVGKYSKSMSWWTCKFMTPHTHSVLAIATHPTYDTVLASGSTDCTLRFTCIDTAAKAQPSFGFEHQKFELGSWVHALQFTPNATQLIACLHSSQVVVLTTAGDADSFGEWQVANKIATSGLPFRRLSVLSDTTAIAAGFDFFPVKFLSEDGSPTNWKIVSEGKQSKAAAVELSETEKARLRFQNEATLGQKDAVELPKTRHSNTITSVLAVPSAAAGAGYMFLTTGVDGRAEAWKDGDMMMLAKK